MKRIITDCDCCNKKDCDTREIKIKKVENSITKTVCLDLCFDCMQSNLNEIFNYLNTDESAEAVRQKLLTIGLKPEESIENE